MKYSRVNYHEGYNLSEVCKEKNEVKITDIWRLIIPLYLFLFEIFHNKILNNQLKKKVSLFSFHLY